MMVLAGILMLITAVNLKIIVWYIDRKQTKKALQQYTEQEKETFEEAAHSSFLLTEIKSVENIEQKLDIYLDALKSKRMEKIGIIKDDKLVGVIISIEIYEKLMNISLNANREQWKKEAEKASHDKEYIKSLEEL